MYVSEGGSYDRKFNRSLERAIITAKKSNVPNTTIDQFLKKAVSINISDI